MALDGLYMMRGDDLERAKAAFKYCTPKEMKQLYGQSGQTRQQILDEYQEHCDRVDEAVRWLKSVKI